MNGERLKKILAKTGLSKAEIAKRLEMSPQHLNQALNAADIKSGLIEKICKGLNMTIMDLYEIKGNNNATGINASVKVNESEAINDLIAVIKKEQEQKGRMLSIIEDLTSKIK